MISCVEIPDRADAVDAVDFVEWAENIAMVDEDTSLHGGTIAKNSCVDVSVPLFLNFDVVDS